jgi:hypothetical protein
MAAAPRRAAMVAAATAIKENPELPKATISGAQFGLKSPVLKVHTAEEPKRFAVTSASVMLGSIEPRSPQNAAESYTEDLFQRGRVDLGSHADESGVHHSFVNKTHVIVMEDGDLVLKRRAFECGFD